MMGGNFDGQRRREFNIRIDIPAARAVFDRWPTDILVSPWEVGGQIFYRCAALDKISYAAQHPLKMAYASYLPLPYDRECWDQTAVMAGVEEPAKWFGLSSRGKVEVDDEGRTEFTSAPNGRIRILQTTPGQRKKAEKYIMQLVGQTPENTRPGNNLPAECTSNDSGGRNFCCRCRLSMASRNSQFLLIFSHNQS